jgi:hypothetical protein
MKTALRFPRAPSIEGAWMPIFLEPIIGSGEKIAVAIACTADRNRKLVSKIIPDGTLRCMYGVYAEKVRALVELITVSISDHLSTEHSLSGWIPPFGGVQAGPVFPGQGDDLHEIISQAAAMVSSLSRPHELLLAQGGAEAEGHEDRWEKQIESAVSAKAPALTQSFGMTQDLGKIHAKIRFSFMTATYAANFGLIVPTNLSSSFIRSKAKLMDLYILKNAQMLLKQGTIELILGTPHMDDRSLSNLLLRRVIETIEQMESHAAGEGVGIVRTESPEDAAAHILKMAA